MAFEASKHKVALGKGAVFKPMLNDDGTAVAGAFGASGAVEAIGERDEAIGIDKIILTRGSGFKLHTHPGHHILYVLRGRGFLRVDGVDYTMARGDTFYVPAEYPHAMRADKNVKLVVLAIGFPHRHVDAQDRMRVVAGGEY